LVSVEEIIAVWARYGCGNYLVSRVSQFECDSGQAWFTRFAETIVVEVVKYVAAYVRWQVSRF
jgi:hypothetical protein